MTPKALARLETRAEMCRPGLTERTFGGRNMGTGIGGVTGGSIFGSLVGGFVGSMIAEQFFNSIGEFGFGESYLSAQPGNEQVDYSVAGYDYGSDWGGGDFGRCF
jgi:hypothetical protein